MSDKVQDAEAVNAALPQFAYETWQRQADLFADAKPEHTEALRAAHDIWADIAYRTAQMLGQPEFIPPARILNRMESYSTADILIELDNRTHHLRNHWYNREADFVARGRYNRMRVLSIFWHRFATLNENAHEIARAASA